MQPIPIATHERPKIYIDRERIGGNFPPEDMQIEPLEALPDIPPQRPPSRLRIRIIKALAKWLLKALLRSELGPIGIALDLLDLALWAYDYYPYIQSYLDPPKPLKELQDSVRERKKGYDVHHIVEQDAARRDGFPESKINSRENLVRIPSYKHHEISAWYNKKSDQFGGQTPREYLRGKSWEERMIVGKRAMKEAGVLAP